MADVVWLTGSHMAWLQLNKREIQQLLQTPFSKLHETSANNWTMYERIIAQKMTKDNNN